MSVTARPLITLAATILCGLIIYSPYVALPAAHPFVEAAPLLAMGRTPDTQGTGVSTRLDSPGASGPEGKASQPSELSRQAVSRKVELKKSFALSMRNEAYTLQEQCRAREAVLLYRESLIYWPDEGLETYIRALEARGGFVTPGKGQPSQGNRTAAGREQAVLATFRNRSAVDVTVRSGGNKEGTGQTVLAGDIMILSVPVTQGQVPFSVLVNGKVIASAVWYEEPSFAGGVPCLLFDTALSERVVIMTGLRKEGT